MTDTLAKLNNLKFDNQHPSEGDCRSELLRGLKQKQKFINAKFFYDAKGSELFDEITRLDEYYPTRTEMAILQDNSEEIADYCGKNCVLIEPGSGTSEKIRLLLNALQPKCYVPLDISAEFLFEAATTLVREYPWLQVHAICADFVHNWKLPNSLPSGKRLIFYPGSTIGNLEPEKAVAQLERLSGWMEDTGGALIGVDLHKCEKRLHAAYNDSRGVTADFNLNVLSHINRLLDAEFDPEAFTHHAFYNKEDCRVEMHLVSDTTQSVKCQNDIVHFTAGETIHTENSYKYTLESFADMAMRAGLKVVHSWLDDEALFSVHYLERAV